MQREILFRGKRIDNGGWVQGSLLAYADGDTFICCEDYIPDVLNKYEVDPATVGQYTGIADKNGVRIFEGDIVQSLNQVYDTDWIVVYEDGKYLADNINMPWIEDLIDVVMGNCVVIGNRFENPELLEVEN